MGMFNVIAFLQIFAPNYWAYAILRVFAGYSSGGLQLVAYVLASEWTLEKKKVFVGVFFFPLSVRKGRKRRLAWAQPGVKLCVSSFPWTRKRVL